MKSRPTFAFVLSGLLALATIPNPATAQDHRQEVKQTAEQAEKIFVEYALQNAVNKGSFWILQLPTEANFDRGDRGWWWQRQGWVTEEFPTFSKALVTILDRFENEKKLEVKNVQFITSELKKEYTHGPQLAPSIVAILIKAAPQSGPSPALAKK